MLADHCSSRPENSLELSALPAAFAILTEPWPSFWRLHRQEYVIDKELAFEYIEINWAAFDGAQSVLVCVLENERHVSKLL